MSKKVKFLLIFILAFLISNKVLSEQIVYINIEKIMKESKAGKKIIEKISKSNEDNINKFKKIEEDLKKQEQDLISKKNVISENEFQTKVMRHRPHTGEKATSTLIIKSVSR